MKNSLILLFSIFLIAPVLSQSENDHVPELYTMLEEFVAIPNFGLNKSDVEKNIDWLVKAYDEKGFETQVLATDGNPLFFAEYITDPALPTILFYMHLDGQAVDKSKWDQSDPYKMVLKEKNDDGAWNEIPMANLSDEQNPEWRFFGRSTSDDKGPIVAFLHAMEMMKTTAASPAINIKVVLDGEEEIGSKSLAAAVKKYRDILEADALIINDGPVHISGKPTLTFGCRGITTINMTVFGPVLPQHSGHYGNYAPNPIFRLSHLLSSMKDDEGRVLIDGYYDGIELTDEVKEVLAAVPDDPNAIHDLLQIAEPEKVGSNYQESLQYPSFNARGVAAAWVGAQARTVVPNTATVAIDMRLVPESDPVKLIAAVKAHIEKEGFHIVDHEPTFEERKKYPKLIYFKHIKSTYPFRTDLNEPVGKWLEKVLTNTYNETPVKIRIMGGTVPIAAFINELNIPAVIVPMVNPDNNQHSPNENIRLGHLNNAAKTFLGIITTPMK